MATKNTNAVESAKETTTIFFEGVLVSAYKKSQTSSDGSKVSKNKVNITTDDKNLWDVLAKVYENTPKKFIPEWFKNRDDKNMVSLKSTYDIPIRIDETGDKFTFEAFCDRGLIRGAKVKMKCNVRDFSVYPSAMVVYEEGEAYDAFEGF